MAEPTPPPAPASPRVGRLARGFLILVAFLSLALGTTAWIFTRSWYIASRVEPILAAALGGEVSIGGAAYLGEGRFRFDDLVVRVPHLAGPAGEIAFVERATVRLDMASLLAGRPRVEGVVVESARLRIAEDEAEANRFSFLGLRPAASAAPEGVLPQIALHRATVEYGDLGRDGAWTPRGVRTFTGRMDPIEGDRERYHVRLTEIDSEGRPPEGAGIVLDGSWETGTFHHEATLTGLVLDATTRELCPALVRAWWEQMELEGQVAALHFAWSGGTDVSAELRVREVVMTIPVPIPDLWARYERGEIEPTSNRPRMRVSRGTIRVAADRLELRGLEGEMLSTDPGAVPVPYRVTATIRQLPALDWAGRDAWIARVADVAPFEMTFACPDLVVAPDGGQGTPAVEMPAAVARVLSKFRLDAWRLSTEVSVWRDPPRADGRGSFAPSRIESLGRARITEAQGVFHRFPYALDDVEASVRFDTDRVELVELSGTGSGGGRLTMQGTVEPPSAEGRVAMRLIAREVPVDDRLRDALNDPQRRAYDALQDQASLDRLRRAGLAPDAAFAEAARAAAAEADDPGHRARLERRAEFDGFELGGVVDLDLSIDRPLGVGQRTVVTGSIDVREARLLFERFPYPARVGAGRIDWTDEGLVVSEERPLPITVAGGGHGTVSGTVRFPPPGSGGAILPDVHVRIADDETTPLLLAAIPLSEAGAADPVRAAGWPGTTRAVVAEQLDRLRVSAALNYAARITGDDAGGFAHRVAVTVRDGNAAPGSLLADFLDAEGLVDPDDWPLSGIAGSLIVEKGAARIETLTGRHPRGVVRMSGDVARPDGEPAELRFELEGWSLAQELATLVGRSTRDRLAEAWNRLRPEGTFDAVVDCAIGEEEVAIRRIALTPHTLQLRLEEGPVLLSDISGSLRLEGGAVHCDGLRATLEEAEGPAGTITIDGAIGTADAPRIEATGNWTGARLGSAAVHEAVRLAAGAGAARRYSELRPGGTVDGSFTVASGGGAPIASTFLVHPRRISFELRGTPVALDVEPGGSIHFSPDLIELDGLRGRGASAQIAVSGTIVPGDDAIADLVVGIEGSLVGAQVAAFLPEPALQVLRTLELGEGGPTTVDAGRLHLERRGEAGWAVRFAGRLDFEDASLRAGLEWSGIDGPLDLVVVAEPGAIPVARLVLDFDRARILGQHLERVRARVELSADGSAVEIADLTARAGAGMVAADARVGLGEEDAWRVATRLVRVPLGDFLLDEAGREEGAGEEPGPKRSPPTGDLYADIRLRGRRGDPAATIGRGFARVTEGDLGAVPLAVQIGQLLQLSLPQSAMDFGELDFCVVGRRLVVERLVLESTVGDQVAHAFTGSGVVNLDSRVIDGRLSSRGGVMVVRDLIGGIGDELAAIRVGGTLWDPEIDLVALPRLNDRAPGLGAPPRRRGAPAPPPIEEDSP